MVVLRILATAICVIAPMAGSFAAASETISFPSAGGSPVGKSIFGFGGPTVPIFMSADRGTIAFSRFKSFSGKRGRLHRVPLPPPAPYDARFGYGYEFGFLTRALISAPYANYVADYNRLFAPNAAVSTWTERVWGSVDAGYGGAIDSWTAGVYYLAPIR